MKMCQSWYKIFDRLQGKQEKEGKKGSIPPFHIAILRRLGQCNA